MFNNLKEDLKRYVYHEGLTDSSRLKKVFELCFCQGLIATIVHRMGVSIRKLDSRVIRKPLLAFWFIAKKLVEIIFSIHISGAAELGPGFYIGHFGCFINAKTGRNFTVSQGVTLGHAGGGKKGVPIIGDNVYFGAGSKAIGPVKIGSNVRIGANAVVVKDIPDNSTAVGIPAKVIVKDSRIKKKVSAAIV